MAEWVREQLQNFLNRLQNLENNVNTLHTDHYTQTYIPFVLLSEDHIDQEQEVVYVQWDEQRVSYRVIVRRVPDDEGPNPYAWALEFNIGNPGNYNRFRVCERNGQRVVQLIRRTRPPLTLMNEDHQIVTVGNDLCFYFSCLQRIRRVRDLLEDNDHQYIVNVRNRANGIIALANELHPQIIYLWAEAPLLLPDPLFAPDLDWLLRKLEDL